MHCLTPRCCLSHSDTRVNAPGTRALSSRVHSAGPAHVHSWVAIKFQQRDPWDMDEKRRKRQEEGGFAAKGSFKSVVLHCFIALNTSSLQIAGLRSFLRCGGACSVSKRFLFLFCKTYMHLLSVASLVRALLNGTHLSCFLAHFR